MLGLFLNNMQCYCTGLDSGSDSNRLKYKEREILALVSCMFVENDIK